MHSCKIAHHELYTIYPDGEIHSGKLDIYLVPRISNTGYKIVTLDAEQLLVHRLVALHYVPNPYGYTVVNHLDGDKLNTHFSNLEWCTHTQNAQHALATGLRKGFVHVDVKREMLQRVLSGERVSDLALEIGNHPNTLNRMLRLQAEKDGLFSEWTEEAKRKRKTVALLNLGEYAHAKNRI